PADWVSAVVDDLRANRGTGVVVVGEGQPPEVHAIANRINHALGNVGESVTFIEPVDVRPENHLQSLTELVADMQAGKVDTLVILGANPVYEAPAELGFADALSKVALRAHLSTYYDETSFLCDWHVPETHFLERWGDTRAYDGTVSIQQPLI